MQYGWVRKQVNGGKSGSKEWPEWGKQCTSISISAPSGEESNEGSNSANCCNFQKALYEAFCMHVHFILTRAQPGSVLGSFHKGGSKSYRNEVICPWPLNQSVARPDFKPSAIWSQWPCFFHFVDTQLPSKGTREKHKYESKNSWQEFVGTRILYPVQYEVILKSLLWEKGKCNSSNWWLCSYIKKLTFWTECVNVRGDNIYVLITIDLSFLLSPK